jgi:hypothetical protein
MPSYSVPVQAGVLAPIRCSYGLSRVCSATVRAVKLVSSLTLFTSVAADLDASPELSTFVARADEILAVATTQGMSRCTTTAAALAR